MGLGNSYALDCRIVEYVDLHFVGRFPRARLQPLPSHTLSPGSSFLADSAGVAASIPINRNRCKYKYNDMHVFSSEAITY